jgi:hypothetical protein
MVDWTYFLTIGERKNGPIICMRRTVWAKKSKNYPKSNNIRFQTINIIILL